MSCRLIYQSHYFPTLNPIKINIFVMQKNPIPCFSHGIPVHGSCFSGRFCSFTDSISTQCGASLGGRRLLQGFFFVYLSRSKTLIFTSVISLQQFHQSKFRCCSDLIELHTILIELYYIQKLFRPPFVVFFSEFSDFAGAYGVVHEVSPAVRIKGVLFSTHGESLLD